MKTTSFVALLAVLGLGGSALAITENYSYTPNQAIPDGNPSGFATTGVVNSAILSLSSVVVSVTISGTVDTNTRTYNGDLYVYLRHGTGFSVLLNRPGKTAARPFGYADDGGLNISFSDTAASGDVHLYTQPAAGQQLLGTWQPDARVADPDTVLDSSARTAFLGSFNGLDANGAWTLFVADVSSGEEMTLNSWSLQLIGVPEPGSLALLAGAGLLGLTRRRR